MAMPRCGCDGNIEKFNYTSMPVQQLERQASQNQYHQRLAWVRYPTLT